MIVNEVKALVFDNALLGLRFTTDEGVLDTDKESLTKEGILNINLPNRADLIPHDNLLITQEELDSGITAKDVSDQHELLRNLIASLDPDLKVTLTTFQKAYEQSLETFMADENWQPIRVNRTDEHKNQHHMLQPDGRNYGGGWIGSHRTLEKAKSTFHYEQTLWAIHRGNTVSPEAVKSYPDLKQYTELIDKIKQTIKIENSENPIVTMLVDNELKSFELSTFKRDPRYELRGFVTENGLQDSVLAETPLLNRFMDMRELTIVAIIQSISDFKNIPVPNPYYNYLVN